MSLETFYLKMRVSDEDFLLQRKFDRITPNFDAQIPYLIDKYLDREEYENCRIAQDYLDYINQNN